MFVGWISTDMIQFIKLEITTFKTDKMSEKNCSWTINICSVKLGHSWDYRVLFRMWSAMLLVCINWACASHVAALNEWTLSHTQFCVCHFEGAAATITCMQILQPFPGCCFHYYWFHLFNVFWLKKVTTTSVKLGRKERKARMLVVYCTDCNLRGSLWCQKSIITNKKLGI